jgi:hypothetical protein
MELVIGVLALIVTLGIGIYQLWGAKKAATSPERTCPLHWLPEQRWRSLRS